MKQPIPVRITASCAIVNNKVYKNEQLSFQNENTGVGDFLLSVYQYLDIKYPKFYKMDNLAKLGWLAAEVLLKDNFTAGVHPPYKTGVVLANASASLDTDIKYYETAKDLASPALFVYTLPNIVIGEICIRHGFKGENGFFVAEAFDAAFIEGYVKNLFENDILDCCICGWVQLLGHQYKTVLFLIEKGDAHTGNAFTTENINKLYQLQHG